MRPGLSHDGMGGHRLVKDGAMVTNRGIGDTAEIYEHTRGSHLDHEPRDDAVEWRSLVVELLAVGALLTRAQRAKVLDLHEIKSQ